MTVALILVGMVALVQVIKFVPEIGKWFSEQDGTSQGDQEENICSAESGYTLCGYCDEDALLSGNPYAGKCRYCPNGYTCQGSVCGELTCAGSGGTSDGSGTTNQTSNYYILCWDCQGVSSVSYNGRDYATCGYYWGLCDVYQCRNMRRKCW